MADNTKEVTADNSLLILIDHQPWVAFGVNSIGPSLLSNNLGGLASSAQALESVQAGATPINWVGVVCEWAPDFTSDERHKANPAVMKNGAGVGLALEQAFAQS